MPLPDLEQAALAFAAMGSEPRLAIVKALVRAGEDGFTVSDLQARVDMPGATLNHHLKALAAARVITQEKRGRSVHNRANFDAIHALSSYLLNECCADAGASTIAASTQRVEVH